MKLLQGALQALGIVVLIPLVAIATLRFEYRHADGPSVLFPGGELVAGELHTGAEPDWRFTDEVGVVELQLEDPLSSRRVWIVEHGGQIYVPSGYMTSVLGRIWKHWAFHADEGDGLAVVRIDGTRYERRLVRIRQGPELDGIAAKMASKYGAPMTRADIEAGNTWIFELAPREG